MRNGRRGPRAPRSRRTLLLALSLPAVALALALAAVMFAAGSAAASKLPFNYGLPAHSSAPRWARGRGKDVHFYPAMSSAARRSASGSRERPSDEAPEEEEPEEPPGLNSNQGPGEDQGDLGRRCGGCLGVPLRYYGGPIQHEPEVHVIFWGSNWNEATGPGPALREELMRFYEGLADTPSGEAFQGILTQYFDGSGRVAPTLPAQRLDSFTDVSVGAPSGVSDAKLRQEARSVAAENGWALGPEAQLVVVPAPGATYEPSFDDDFCAYHSVVVEPTTHWTYTFLSYNGEEPFESGCISYDGSAAGHAEKALRVLSMDASHEYAESATDPTFEAWLDEEGNELADICSSGDNELADHAWVQGLWDDHLGACALEDTHPPHVLALTEPPSSVGQHEATLNAAVNPENEGLQASYRFEYGPSSAYGQAAPAEGLLSVGSALGNQPVHEALSGLSEGTTYHYRVLAMNAREETTYGEDHTFVPSLWSSSDIQPAEAGGQAGQASFGSALVSCSFLPWSCGGVSCPARTSCVAVGSYELSNREVPMAETWTSGQWSFQALPFPAQTGEQVALTGVSCTSPSACLSVGYERNAAGVREPVSDQLTGPGAWSVSPVSLPGGASEAGLEGVSCASSGECMAVGLSVNGSGEERPYSALWRNGTWSVQPVPYPQAANAVLEGVSCPSAASCLAVGFAETSAGVKTALTDSWNGAAWSLAPAKAPPAGGDFLLSAVSCSSPGACMAVGEQPASVGYASLAERWDGEAWSLQSTASSGFSEELLGVSCPASGECTAVGDYAPGAHAVGLVQTWNGESWSAQPSNVDEAQASELHAVSCAGASTCAAVGLTGWSAQARSRSGAIEALAEIRYEGPPLTPGSPAGATQPESPAGTSTPGTTLVSVAPGPALVASRRAAVVRCRVPRLNGDTLKGARARLGRAHCKLGQVRRQRRSHGTLVVRAQSHSVGASLTANAKVNVTLGTAPRAPARRR